MLPQYGRVHLPAVDLKDKVSHNGQQNAAAGVYASAAAFRMVNLLQAVLVQGDGQDLVLFLLGAVGLVGGKDALLAVLLPQVVGHGGDIPEAAVIVDLVLDLVQLAVGGKAGARRDQLADDDASL